MAGVRRLSGASVYQAVVLVPITLLALGYRLWGLDWYSLWFDEALEVWRASGGWTRLLVGRPPAQDPPLFALFNRLWLAVGSSEYWLRLPAVLLGTAAVLLLGVWASRHFGRRVGTLAALLGALAPVQVHYARELNQYAPLLLLTMMLVLAYERLLANDRPRDWALLGGLSVVALGTHYGLVFPLLSLGLALAWRDLRQWRGRDANRADGLAVLRAREQDGADGPRVCPARAPAGRAPNGYESSGSIAGRDVRDGPSRDGRGRRFASVGEVLRWRPRRALVAYAGVCALTVVVLFALGLGEQLAVPPLDRRLGGTHLAKELDYITDTGWREIVVFFLLPFSGGPALDAVRVLGLLTLVGAVTLWRHGPAGRRAVGLYFLAPVALTYVTSLLGRYPMGYRYGLFASLPFLVALAAGLAAAVARRRLLGGALVVGTLAALVVYGPHEAWPNPYLTVPRQELRPVVRALEAQRRPGDVVYVYHNAAPAFRYYYNGPAPVVVWGAPYDRTTVRAEVARIEAAAGPEGRVWLVFAHLAAGDDAALLAALAEKRLRATDEVRARNAHALVLTPADGRRRSGSRASGAEMTRSRNGPVVSPPPRGLDVPLPVSSVAQQRRRGDIR